MVDAAIDFTGGTLGGAAVVLVGQPLDTVKVKLQIFPEFYRSATQCFFHTLRSEGLTRGLYRGTAPSLAANIAENSVLFLSYGMCQGTIAKINNVKITELNAFHKASAGFMAAFFSSLALCPTELIKCKLQTITEMNLTRQTTAQKHNMCCSSAWQLTRQILRQEGVQGMFRGLTSTWAREMPGYFFFFGGYEYTRSLLTQPGHCKDDIGILRTSIAGGVGGCCLWLSVFPADLVKSRIQVLPYDARFMSVLRQIVREQGFVALYSGLGPTLLRTFPSTAALFVTYEYTKKFLSSPRSAVSEPEA